MPYVSKKRKAAFAVWALRKSVQGTLSSTSNSAHTRSMAETLDVQVEDPSLSESPIDIKEEPIELEANPFEIDHSEEIKVEPLEPLVEEPDPIGESPILDQPGLNPSKTYTRYQKLPETEIRCRFCLKLFEMGKHQGFVSRKMAEYVLGVQTWGSHRDGPSCCKECKKMFELFYAFKRSCLAALVHPSVLLASVRQKSEDEVEHSIPAQKNIPKKQISNPSANQQQPQIVNTVDPPVISNNESSNHNIKERPETQPIESQQIHTMEYAVEMLPPGESSNNTEIDMTSTEHFEPQTEVFKQTTEKPMLECQICCGKFTDASVLKQHWQSHFGTISAKETATTSVVQSFNEDSTSKAIGHEESDTMEHQSSDPQISPIELVPTEEISTQGKMIPDSEKQTNLEHKKDGIKYCARCQKYFGTELIFTHHKPYCIKAPSKKRPSFPCSKCPQTFSVERKYQLHMNKHNGVRTIPCRMEGCSKMYYSTKSRSDHEAVCGQTTPQFICSICAAILGTPSSLRAHMATHIEPTVICEHCNKAFQTRAKLKKHYAVHSDVRKYECKVCGKRFKTLYANQVHQRIHTQEKPYICHICGMAFTYNCLLKTHLEKGHEPESEHS